VPGIGLAKEPTFESYIVANIVFLVGVFTFAIVLGAWGLGGGGGWLGRVGVCTGLRYAALCSVICSGELLQLNDWQSDLNAMHIVRALCVHCA